MPAPNQQGGDLDLEGLVSWLKTEAAHNLNAVEDLRGDVSSQATAENFSAYAGRLTQAADALLSQARVLRVMLEERDEAEAALDANWVQHQRVIAAEARAETAERLLEEVEGAGNEVIRWFEKWAGKTANQQFALEALAQAISNIRKEKETRSRDLSPAACAPPVANQEALRDLLRRVESAAGADRELDGDLFVALAAGLFWPDRKAHWFADGHRRVPAAFTASLDAALALVERCLPGARVMAERTHEGRGWAMLRPAPGEPREMADGATPALAVLRTLIAELAAPSSHERLAAGTGTTERLPEPRERI